MISKLNRAMGIGLKTTNVEVPHLVKRSGKVRNSQASVLSPHRVCSALEHHPKFPVLFGTSPQWQRLWHLLRHEDFLVEHPYRQWISENGAHACPVLLHGDDAPVSRRVGRNIHALTMFSPFHDPNLDSIFSHMPLFLCANDDPVVKVVRNRLEQTVGWSLKASATNIEPTVENTPTWIKLSKEDRARAGQPISSSGIRFIYLGLTGDQMFHAMDYNLPYHYNTDPEMCQQCGATKDGEYAFYDCRLTCKWKDRPRTFGDYLRHLEWANTNIPPIVAAKIGWHTSSNFEDFLHADPLGIRLHANASCLVELCREGVFRPYPVGRGAGNWDDRLNRCLSAAYQDFQRYLCTNSIVCNHPLFTCLSLTMHDLHDFPVLKAKGRNAIHVSLWLFSVLQRTLDRSNNHACTRFGLFLGLKGMWELPHDIRPRWEFTSAEVNQLEFLRITTLMCYYQLSAEASDANLRIWNMIPKFHQVDHMTRRSTRTYISWVLWWTWASEDVIGQLAKLAGRTHGSSTFRRGVERWLVVFWEFIMDES